MKKTLSLIFSLVIIMATAITTFASTSGQPAGSSANTNSSIFTGYAVTVLDKTTPAATTRGKVNDLTTMYFVSAADQVVGSISYKDFEAITLKYETTIIYPNGSKLAAPPDGYDNWNIWFADRFNDHRGLAEGSREAAVKAHSTKLVDEYRQAVIKLTNAEREKAGLPALEVDADAMTYAQIRAEEISTSFSHERPNGAAKEINGMRPIEIITAAGLTPEEAVAAWMASEGHRNNMLNPDAYAFGVGAYQTSNGTWFWTQEFLW